MPFPLAHPAAVLPLRRYCPRFLSFPALVIGSIAPDFGYCFGDLNVEDLSHRSPGSPGFAWLSRNGYRAPRAPPPRRRARGCETRQGLRLWRSFLERCTICFREHLVYIWSAFLVCCW